MGLGYAAKAILDARRKDQVLTRQEIERICEEAESRAKSDKRNWSLNVLVKEIREHMSIGQEYAEYQSQLRAIASAALNDEVKSLEREKREFDVKVTRLSKELQIAQERLDSSVPEADHLKALEDLDRIENQLVEVCREQEKAQQKYTVLEKRHEQRVRKASEVIMNRMRKCYPSVRMRHDNTYKKLGSMRYEQVHAIEVQIGLLEHSPEKARWRGKIAGTYVNEIGCNGDLRIYVSWQDNGYVIEEVGNKLTQDADLRRLKERCSA